MKLTIVTNTPTVVGREWDDDDLCFVPVVTRIWAERTYVVYSVRRLDADGGKTGKGVLHFFATGIDGRGKENRLICGQYMAVDIEDVVRFDWASDF